jgi:hypothetical protein
MAGQDWSWIYGRPRRDFELSKPLKSLERVKGIEPSYSAWKAAALPLSYTRVARFMQRGAEHCNMGAALREAPHSARCVYPFNMTLMPSPFDRPADPVLPEK